MSKGLHPSWYAQKLKEIKELLAGYEISVDEYPDEFWVFKITYQDKKLFDYYPKNRKLLRSSKKGNNVWETLNENYLEDLKNICEGYIQKGKVNVDFKPRKASKILPQSWYKEKLKEIKDLLSRYEIEIEIYDYNYWRFRATYFGKLLFDYYPKNRTLSILQDDANKMYTLDENYLKHFETICEGFLLIDEIRFRGVESYTLG